MKAHENLWALVDGNGRTIKTVVQPDHPTLDAGQDEDWFAWVPVYAKRRVTGDRYTPYSGNSDWVRVANEAMAEAANDNFRRRNGY